MTPEFHHVSVLFNECIEGLNIKPDGVYADATLGGGGHSSAIAAKLTTGHLYGIDRDEDALRAAGKRLEQYGERVRYIHSNFRNMAEHIHEPLDGILFDLGVSSFQLDETERGFSYMHDAPLDMRMDRTDAVTAYDIINGWTRDELRRIIFEYGEEKFAPLVAAAIERSREKKPIETTLELAEIIASAVPNAKKEKQHPAKRTFQAIRIAVNDELASVRDGINAAVELLAPGGRILVISFHSLEDRIVKTEFKNLAQGCTCPPDFPVCVCGKKPKIRILTNKPIVPGEEELNENPRSRSSKLRIAEKL